MRTKSTPHVMKLSSCLNYNYLLMISVLHSNLRGAFSTNSASLSSLIHHLYFTLLGMGIWVYVGLIKSLNNMQGVITQFWEHVAIAGQPGWMTDF